MFFWPLHQSATTATCPLPLRRCRSTPRPQRAALPPHPDRLTSTRATCCGADGDAGQRGGGVRGSHARLRAAAPQPLPRLGAALSSSHFLGFIFWLSLWLLPRRSVRLAAVCWPAQRRRDCCRQGLLGNGQAAAAPATCMLSSARPVAKRYCSLMELARRRLLSHQNPGSRESKYTLFDDDDDYDDDYGSDDDCAGGLLHSDGAPHYCGLRCAAHAQPL